MITNKRILYDTTLELNPENMVSDMDGEKVILSIKNGKYYNLGAIGSEIWTLIDQQTTMNHIINNLLTKYDISLEDCCNQVNEFLDQLLREELIQIIENGNSQSLARGY
jgi:hypothetical protein